MDVIVAGAGPAGLAASAALARRGLSVTCIAPEHPSPWPNNYGVWEDELIGLGIEDCFERRYEKAVVYTGQDRRRELDRVYLRIDNEKLRGRLCERCEAGDVQFVEGWAEALRLEDAGVVVVDAEQRAYRAALLIDATGHRPRFVERPASHAGACQVAYGFVGEFDGHPMGGDELVLMDFREDFYGEKLRTSAAPSFLYAMQLAEGRYFVEETSLVHRPALTFDILEDRLAGRLRTRGVPVVDVDEVERCIIPMNHPLPDLEQRVVGFGGAASMVHPATGYQLGAALRTAPVLAEAVADSLGAGGADPAKAAKNAWRAIWPVEKVRARTLWLFGQEVLLELDARQTRAFFEVFFSLPEEMWQGYMSGTLAPDAVAGVMWSMFRRMPISLKFSVGRTAFGKKGLAQLRTSAEEYWSL